MLQAFDSIDFAVDGFPQGTLAPAEWKTGGGKGRKTMEYVHPKVHLTMYFKVSMPDSTPIMVSDVFYPS